VEQRYLISQFLKGIRATRGIPARLQRFRDQRALRALKALKESKESKVQQDLLAQQQLLRWEVLQQGLQHLLQMLGHLRRLYLIL
jgi:hypothetical protein